jgi:hypothetical protein
MNASTSEIYLDSITMMSSDNNSFSNTTETNSFSVPIYILVLLPLKIIVILLTVFLNLFIIIIVLFKLKKKTYSNYLFLSITVSDFIVGCSSMSFMTIFTYYSYWPLGYYLCAFWVVVDWSTSTVNLVSVLMLTIQRYCLIKYPFKTKEKMDGQKRALIFFSWLIPYSYWIISVILITYNPSFDYVNCYFTYTPTYVLVSDLIAFGLPIFLNFYFGILTTAQLRKKKQKKYPVTTTNSKENGGKSVHIEQYSVATRMSISHQKVAALKHGKVLKTDVLGREEKALLCIAMVTLNIIVFWILFLVAWPLYAFCECLSGVLMEVSYWLAYLSSTTSPIMVLFFNAMIKKEFLRFFKTATEETQQKQTTQHNTKTDR